MPEETSRTDQEGQGSRYGLIIDLSSSKQFNPSRLDREIKRVGFRTELPDRTLGDMYHAKFVVVGDRIILFSSDYNHLEGIEWMKKVFPDVDLNGEIQCAGDITVSFHQGGFGNTRPIRVIAGMSTGLLQNGTLSEEKSEEYKRTVLKEKLGDYFDISR